MSAAAYGDLETTLLCKDHGARHVTFAGTTCDRSGTLVRERIETRYAPQLVVAWIRWQEEITVELDLEFCEGMLGIEGSASAPQ